jgi:undecaprenyl phosphate-alpha-L-ara4N flippase subunit ArnE
MIWISVILSSLAQLFLKHGLTKVQARRESGIATMVMRIAFEPFIWLWGVSFVVAMGLWLVGLQKLDLSYAYPLVSMGYVLVTVLSYWVFNERVDARRWLAVAVISVGVILIAGS